jgi:cysteine desulfurase/selenocysteine lyase
MSSSETFQLSLHEIEEELRECDSPTERLEYLVELGASLPEFPGEACIESNRVLGCQSMVWLVPRIVGSQIYLRATSDAPMVRGLIAILLAAYSGQTARAIRELDIEAFFDRIQLRSFITPMRSNGLHSMVLRIREIAAGILEQQDAGKARPATAGQPAPQPQRPIHSTRADFPILIRRHSAGRAWAYLDNAASSQRPKQVLECMAKVYEEHYSNVHRAGHQAAAETTSAMEASRESVANFIGAPRADQVIFTNGTTAGINLVARAWGDANLANGDEILLTEMEHHSNIVPWQQLAARTGARIRWCPIDDGFRLDLTSFREMLTPRVKLVAVTAVSNVLGTINPIEAIVSLSHANGSVVLIDAAQAVPHAAIDVQAAPADFVVFSGHKMLGPTGIGVLYGQRRILEAMPPFLGGGNMIHAVTKEGYTPAGLPHRFEAGTAPIVEAIAMRPAVEYLASLGSREILAHERRLASIVHERFAKYPRIRVLGPDLESKSGIVSFVVDGIHADEIGRRLDAEGVAIRVGHHCAMPLHQRLGVTASCRASFYFYNTADEAERLAELVAGLAQ